MPKSKYLRTREVAEKLGVNCRTVYRYLTLGLLYFIKPAGIIYVTRASYESFLKKRGTKPKPRPKPKRVSNEPRRMIRKAAKNPNTNLTNQNLTPDHSPNIAME